MKENEKPFPTISQDTIDELLDLQEFQENQRLAHQALQGHQWSLVVDRREAQVVYDALGYWSSDDNDAPHDEIIELRARLVRIGAVSP